MSAIQYFPGMGEAVADRTINRRIFTDEQAAKLPHTLKLNRDDPLCQEWQNAAELSCHKVRFGENYEFQSQPPETRVETWRDVAKRVSEGNTKIVTGEEYDQDTLLDHMLRGTVLLSGRHLQHTDKNIKFRPQEVLTNCSTSVLAFISFYLLLNGSGVGRCYDDDMMVVDWREMPNVRIVIDADYPDRQLVSQEWCDETGGFTEKKMVGDHFKSLDETLAEIPRGAKHTVFTVPDSRGGWAKAVEVIERFAFEKRTNEYLIIDFSLVRKNGDPIRGMQNRPASGPGPLMDALYGVSKVKGMGLEPWESAMHVDHHLAKCVLVGGARRAARMATKHWSDRNIFGFITFKRRNDFWTSNNSVTIDNEFRELSSVAIHKLRTKVGAHAYEVMQPDEHVGIAFEAFEGGLLSEDELHAYHVLIEIADASFHDGTGEPGLVNQDKLKADDTGVADYLDGLFADSKDYQLDGETLDLTKALAACVVTKGFTMIVNPCGEIALLMLGAYCVIADVVPFHAANDDDLEQAFRAAVRALIRVNTMDSLYKREVRRTNRIGVGMTGMHEWFYDRFGFTWHDIIDEHKSREMWMLLSRFRRAITQEAESYATHLGVTVPHTNTTVKPAGTTSKLFGLSEGAHLPSMRWYMRWVQFRSDDPLIADYEARKYPVRQLKKYPGTTIVGFPTAPSICQLGTGEWVVTAAEATPEEQYQFLRLLEKYWIRGVDEDGQVLAENFGNQVSYTMKYDPEKLTFNDFLRTLVDGQFSIKCCSVMPQEKTGSVGDGDDDAYEYLPEEPLTKEMYEFWAGQVQAGVEDIGVEHVDCASGACPIDFGAKV